MVTSLENRAKNLRYERKFFIEHSDLHQVQSMIKRHRSMPKEIFYQRQINNLYFDTPNKQFYHENVNGDHDRMKVRIRWYGNMHHNVSNPVLEFKIKKGPVGYKESFILNGFKFDQHLNQRAMNALFKSNDLPEMVQQKLKSIEPVLINSYQRKYYLSSCQDVRITLDWHIQCTQFTPIKKYFVLKPLSQKAFVIELKYDSTKDNEIHRHFGDMPFTLTKSSKYVQALEQLYRHH